MLYYQIEKILARYTDCLITINEEDYQRAITHRFKARSIEHVHGVGVDTDRYKPLSEKEKLERRLQYGYTQNDFLLFYAAEFNKNKNQQLLIKALAELKQTVPDVKLLLAGEGILQCSCKQLAIELNVQNMIEFLGYRKDIVDLLPMCDVAVASSLREGLPVNIMEAMACGLPVVATENRGHNELVNDLSNGWIVKPDDIKNLVGKIKHLTQDKHLIKTLGVNGRNKIEKGYSIKTILNENSLLYERYMKEMEGIKWKAQ